MLRDRELPEPAESIVFITALPLTTVLSFGAMLVVNVGSFAIIPFAVCAENILKAGSSVSARIVAATRMRSEAMAGNEDAASVRDAVCAPAVDRCEAGYAATRLHR